MKQAMKQCLTAAILVCGLMLTSCNNDEDNPVIPTPDQPVVQNCVKPDYLVAGDRVALISPSYFTPMENVENTADVLRSWGLEPVIGPNVGKVVDGRYAGTVATPSRSSSGVTANSAAVYDLQGRRLDSAPSLHGVYIKNGQKTVIK